MKSFIYLLFIIFFLNGCASTLEKSKCLSYNKTILEGIIEKRPLEHDDNEFYWILVTKSFCTIVSQDETLYESYDNQTEIHLSIYNYEKYRHLLKKQVQVSGELYSKHTRHHRRNVLMLVDSIEVKK